MVRKMFPFCLSGLWPCLRFSLPICRISLRRHWQKGCFGARSVRLGRLTKREHIFLLLQSLFLINALLSICCHSCVRFPLELAAQLVTFLSQSAFMLLHNCADFQCVMMFLAIGCFCSLFVAWCLLASSSLSVGDGFGRSPTLLYIGWRRHLPFPSHISCPPL